MSLEVQLKNWNSYHKGHNHTFPPLYKHRFAYRHGSEPNIKDHTFNTLNTKFLTSRVLHDHSSKLIETVHIKSIWSISKTFWNNFLEVLSVCIGTQLCKRLNFWNWNQIFWRVVDLINSYTIQKSVSPVTINF